jgi:hypothetical protein
LPVAARLHRPRTGISPWRTAASGQPILIAKDPAFAKRAIEAGAKALRTAAELVRFAIEEKLG